jgi:hypothetical protein
MRADDASAAFFGSADLYRPANPATGRTTGDRDYHSRLARVAERAAMG